MSTSGIQLAEIDAYIDGTLSDVEAFEEALFTEAGFELAADWTRLVAGIRRNNFRGLRQPFCSVTQAKRVAASELDVIELDQGDGSQMVPTRVTRPCDLVITRYNVDLRGVRELQVDLGLDGVVYKTCPADFDPDDGAFYICCEFGLYEHSVRLAAGRTGLVRAFAVEGNERRLLREFNSPMLGA